MKGLLIKDLLLLKIQKRFLLTVLLVAVFMGITMEDVSFLMGYLTLLLSWFSLSTISYDEFDNGSAFLFTLPITRRLYVLEKYTFSLLTALASTVLSLVFSLGVTVVKGGADPAVVACTAPVLFLAAALLLAVMLPLQLKFGPEKARILLVALCAAIGALGYGAVKLLKLDLSAAVAGLDAISPGAAMGLLAALTLAALAVSVPVSIAITEKKEF